VCTVGKVKGSLSHVSYINFDKSFEDNSFIYLQQAKSEIKALNIFAQMREEICYLKTYVLYYTISFYFQALNKKEKKIQKYVNDPGQGSN
jgi:hypothetical protein